MPQRLAQVLRQLRDGRGMSQPDLAKKAKVPQSYIAELETGAKKNPSLDVLKKIAKALDVPVTELLA